MARPCGAPAIKGEATRGSVSALGHRKRPLAGPAQGQGQAQRDHARLPELLRALELAGGIVTADALPCQKNIAKEIKAAAADYLRALQGNQGPAFPEIKTFLDTAIPREESEPIACWRTLSRKKQTRWPSSAPSGEWSANRKGSCRPARHWCSFEPVHGAWSRTRRPDHWWRPWPQGDGNDPVYAIDYLRLTVRPASGCSTEIC